MCYNQCNYKKVVFLKYTKYTNTTNKIMIFSNFVIVFAVPNNSKILLRLHKLEER